MQNGSLTPRSTGERSARSAVIHGRFSDGALSPALPVVRAITFESMSIAMTMTKDHLQSDNDLPPRRIAMLIYPGVAPLDVSGPLQVFGVANFLAGRKLYDIVTVAPTAEPVPT